MNNSHPSKKNRSSPPPIIGLTGGIGSGKSTAGRFFQELGINVVDVDLVAREIVEPGEPLLEEIAAHFGSDIIQANGQLDRAKLRTIIFSNEKEKLWLEQLTHPEILKRTLEHLKSRPTPYAILMSPILFEANQHRFTDLNIVIDIPEELQIQRATERDNNSREQIERIIKAQISREERRKRADFIIVNDKNQPALKEEVKSVHKKISDQFEIG